MNLQPFGTPKQLFRTAYAPTSPSERPSSLNSFVLTQSRSSHSPSIRFETPSSSSIKRQASKNYLESSPTSLQDLSNRLPQGEYFPVQKKEEGSRKMMLKIEQLEKKVGKNTEQIRGLKLGGKSEQLRLVSVEDRINKMEREKQERYQECLIEIRKVRE